jgi:hypothetical protein
MAAMLATLEGNEKGITLNDLFDVNDYLGVKYFGPEDWNRVKKCACIITMKAAKNPVLFYIDSLKDDYKDYKPSQLANRVFGFNDAAGVELMGALPWERCKVKIDNELLGVSIGGALKKVGSAIGSGVKTAYDVTKTVAMAPLSIGEKVWTETPLKYTPGGAFYKGAKNLKGKVLSVAPPLKEINEDPIQYVTDKSSKILYSAATKTPLKYTGIGIVTKAAEKAREKAGVTSAGTAEVYETQEEKDAKAAAAAAAAGRAAAAATAKQAEQLKSAKNLKAQREQTAAAEAAAAETQTQLEQTQAVLTSKYAPWILGGCGLLLALSILKK